MGGRRGKSTETAPGLLTAQIHTVWGQGNDKVASQLSTDVVGALDTLSHRRLLHDLYKCRIPEWIMHWVESSSQPAE